MSYDNDRSSGARRALEFALAVGACGLLALPFYWMAITALKPSSELALYPPTWWPGEIRFQNLATAWSAAPFGRFTFNSVGVALCATAVQVTFAALMAYAFAVLHFPGKGALFVLVLATMMIPDEMRLIPNYLLLKELGWIDTYQALIIPPAAHAFPVFVFHEHFKTLPRPLFESASLDGASHFRTLWSVVIPLSGPIVAGVTVVAFAGRWNDFLWPLIITDTEGMRTLPVGLSYLRASQEGGVQWNLLMAGSIFVMMPLLALYGFAQRYFVAGLTRGALKG